jgi:uncharacterized membrane protein
MITNFGLKEQVDVPVFLQITFINTTVDEINDTIPRIEPWSTEAIEWKFTPQVQGTYLVGAGTALPDDQIPENDYLAKVLHVTIILFEDHVEQGENGWVHGSTAPVVDLWHIVDVDDPYGDAVSPTHSWYCGVENFEMYAPLAQYTLEREVSIPFTDEAYLVFSHRYDLALGIQNLTIARSDTAIVEISVDHGLSWIPLDRYEGTSAWWATEIYDISPYVEGLVSTHVVVRFRLDSSILEFGRGWWIDDIYLLGEVLDYDFALILPYGVSHATPGKTTSFKMEIWNTGTETDSYLLVADKPAHWNVWFSFDEVTVEPLKRKSVTIYARVPKNAIAKQVVTIPVNVVSDANPVSEHAVYPTVVIDLVRDFEIQGQSSKTGKPGETVEFEVNVNNEGNAPELINLYLQGSDVSVANISSSVLEISAYGSKNIFLWVDVPDNATAGITYEVILKAQNTAKYEVNSTFVVTVERVEGVEVEPVTEDGRAVPGESIIVKFTVKNTGNAQSRMNLTFGLPPLWDLDAQSVVTVGAWETWTVVATIDVDDETPEGSYRVILRVGVGGAEDQAEIEIKVVLPDPAVMSLALSRLEVDEGQNVTVAVEIENVGIGNATNVKVVIYDNGKIILEEVIDNLEPGFTVTKGMSYKFSPGYHTVSVAVAYEGKEVSATNNVAQRDLKVNKKSEIPWPGAGPVLVALAMLALLRRRKRKSI